MVVKDADENISRLSYMFQDLNVLNDDEESDLYRELVKYWDENG